MIRAIVLASTLILIGLLVLAASMDHRGYLELCVCVVNALSRAVIAASGSAIAGMAALFILPYWGRQYKIHLVLDLLQLLLFAATLFFIVQYVLFLLEVVR